MFNPNQQTSSGLQQNPTSQKNSFKQFNDNKQTQSSNQIPINQTQFNQIPFNSQLQGQQVDSNIKSYETPNPEIKKNSQVQNSQTKFSTPQQIQFPQTIGNNPVKPLLQPSSQMIPSNQVQNQFYPHSSFQQQQPESQNQIQFNPKNDQSKRDQVEFIKVSANQRIINNAQIQEYEQGQQFHNVNSNMSNPKIPSQMEQINQQIQIQAPHFQQIHIPPIQDLQKKKNEIQKLESEIQEEDKKLQTNTQQLNIDIQKLDSQLQELKQQFDLIQGERNELQIQLGMETQKNAQLMQQLRDSKRNTYFDQHNQVMSKIDELEDQNKKFKQELQLKVESQSNRQIKEYELKKLSQIVEYKNKQLSEIKSQQSQLNEDIIQFESQLQQRDQSINQMSFDVKKEEKKLKTLMEDIDRKNQDIKLNEEQINVKNLQISQLEGKTLTALRQSSSELKISELKKNVEHNTLMNDLEIERKKQDLTQSKLIQQQRKRDKLELEENQKKFKKQQGKELQLKFKESYGQLEVCFLIDSTKSMEPYKKQAQLCVKGSLKAIKDLTQRDTNWSTVCYVDTDILPSLGGMYQQFGFTKDSDDLERFIQSVRCTGNRDLPEDVDGGIKQMLNNLTWQTKFKIAILICDCPCHGTKFHDYGRNGDYQPDADLTPKIEQIINEDIFFIGIIFTSETIKMYSEIRKIFQRYNKEQYFILSDLRNIPENEQYKQLTQILSNVSQTATQTNVKTTRTLNQTNVIKQANNQELHSSVEALCKINIQQGLNATTAIRETFKVFRVSMKEESFLDKMKQVEKIGFHDFTIIEENEWDCLRSKTEFAKGAMKAAYLMTKSKFMNSKQEFYVCKTPLNLQPYPDRESALKECMLHILSQKWLRKFYKDLNEVTAQTKQQFPQLNYSDLLLLQDSNKKYWLAERFFEGNFVKYNNNWGYVNGSKDDINRLAQSFSIYTHYKSDFQYLICDIQGVGTCLTDPAVCTKNNYKIDPTDMGEEGIGRYMISFGAIKHDCLNILQALKIDL